MSVEIAIIHTYMIAKSTINFPGAPYRGNLLAHVLYTVTYSNGLAPIGDMESNHSSFVVGYLDGATGLKKERSA